MSVSYYGFSDADPEERWKFWESNTPPAIAIDVETISITEKYPLGLGIAFSPYEAFYFQLSPEPPVKALEALRPILSDIRIVKLAHNWMFDMSVFPLIPIVDNHLDRCNIFDTNVAARLLGYQETALPMLATEFGMMTTGAKEILLQYKAKTMVDVPAKEVAHHCQQDVKATYRLWLEWKDKIADRYGEYFRVEMDVIPILIDLSMRGLTIDQAKRQELEDKYSDQAEFYRRMVEESGIKNPGSSQQVGYVLAERGNFLPFTKSKRQLSTRVGELEFLEDPLASSILGYRKNTKFLNTYLIPIKGEEKFYTEYYLDTSVGRLNSRNRNIQNIPLDARCMFLPDNGVFTTGDFCLAPETRILTADLRWIQIKDAKVGNRLIGIDENNPGGSGKERLMRYTTVTGITKVNLPSRRITLADGRVVVASDRHPWLVQNKLTVHGTEQTRLNHWVDTQDLKVGHSIRNFCTPWEDTDSRELGYAGGMLDGEGYIWQTLRMGMVQSDNVSLYKFTDILTMFQIPFTPDIHSNGKAYDIRILGLANIVRTLGMTRPSRLLESFSLDGAKPPRGTTGLKVIRIEPIGVRELISIETSTHTYIAEGLFTHNSREHMFILANFSQDSDMLRIIYDPDKSTNDIHQHTADKMRVTRKLAKTLNYAVAYGATDKTVSEAAKIKDRQKCGRLIEDWFRVYTGAADWVREAKRYGLEHGWSLPTLFGRSIRIPEEYDRYGRLNREGMERKAVNYPILGSDGEVIKRAIIKCNRLGLGPPIMAATVHDSITWDGDMLDRLPVEELEHIPGFRVPFEVKQTLRWE